MAFLPPMAVHGGGGVGGRNSSHPDYHLVDLKARHEASRFALGRKLYTAYRAIDVFRKKLIPISPGHAMQTTQCIHRYG